MKEFRRGAATVRAVDGVSLTVSPGEFVAIMGKVHLLGRDLSRLSDDGLTELKVAYDSFHGLTAALTGVAVLVSALAIASTLFSANLERKREFGVLRAVGTRQGEVVRVVLGEAFSMGVVGGAVGIAAGLALQWAMVATSEFINGASMHRVVDWGSLGVAELVAPVLAPLAGALPARWAARLDVVDALRYE